LCKPSALSKRDVCAGEEGEPFARLVPDDEKVCAGRELAEALSKGRFAGERSQDVEP